MYRPRFQQPIYQNTQQKNRDLAFLIQASFPEVIMDLSNFSFKQPKVNQLLNSILQILNNQSVFALQEGYSGSKEDIFRGTSMLIADFMNYITPFPNSIMWILFTIDSSAEANLQHMHTLFTFICNIKGSYNKLVVNKKKYFIFNLLLMF